MVPSLDLQLQASIKALTDTIGPAIDPSDKMAAEQLHLVIASLAMVRERLPVERRFIRRQLEDAITIAQDVNAVAVNEMLHDAICVARDALASAELGAQELEETRAFLTSRTVELISRAGGDGVERFGSAIVRGSKPSLDRLRAWSVCSGFEPDETEVKSLKELI